MTKAFSVTLAAAMLIMASSLALGAGEDPLFMETANVDFDAAAQNAR